MVTTSCKVLLWVFCFSCYFATVMGMHCTLFGGFLVFDAYGEGFDSDARS